MKFQIEQPLTRLHDMYSKSSIVLSRCEYFVNDKKVTAEQYFGFAERFFDLQYKWATGRWDREEYDYQLSLLMEELNK